MLHWTSQNIHTNTPFVNATTDGVVLDPSEFSITLACLPSITATQELVVPRSIPMTAPLTPSVLQNKKKKENWKHTNTLHIHPFLPRLSRSAQSGRRTSFGRQVWFTESHIVWIIFFFTYSFIYSFILNIKYKSCCYPVKQLHNVFN